MNADRLLVRFDQLSRILSDPVLDLGERTAKVHSFLFPSGRSSKTQAAPFHPDAPRPANAQPLTSIYTRNALSPDGSDPLWQTTRLCAQWDGTTLDALLQSARDIVVLYTELYYDPSLLPVTFYKRQRRIASFLDQALFPLLREHVRRTGATDEPDLFLNEPIFYLKKEARTRAYPKNKHGRINLDFLRERFRLLLMHRTAA